jgi:ADP-ribose pyrophosphatase YjhB (NUDIX family)
MAYIPPPGDPVSPGRMRKRSRRRPGRRHRPVRREVSAGGVVVRREAEQWLVALLKTEHKRGPVWVLPKGHVEVANGERISEAARREVQEEAGLTSLSVKNQLGISRFTFQAEGTLVAKTVHYFLMVTQQKELTPQHEEGLLEAAWFPIQEAVKQLAYDTDQEIVQRAYQQLTGDSRPSTRRSRTLRIHV